jgi:hypothetical protein
LGHWPRCSNPPFGARWRGNWSLPRQRGERGQSINLDIFWLRDESLEETANLPEPDALAAEIVEDLAGCRRENDYPKIYRFL